MCPDCLSLCVLNLFTALCVNNVRQTNNAEKGVRNQLRSLIKWKTHHPHRRQSTFAKLDLKVLTLIHYWIDDCIK